MQNQFFGCIMYADDLIMLSPSLKGLQSMFSASEMTYIVSSGALNSTHSLTQSMFYLFDAYAKTHFLIFNAKKRSLCQ